MSQADGDFAQQRRGMIDEIRNLAAGTAENTGRQTLDSRVLDAMASIPRHEFVPQELRVLAYRNRPLPIGHGQTISQPFIVALMTDLLNLKSSDKVLEVGTGSGYQAAVLSRLAAEVYSLEIVEQAAKDAASALTRLGFHNVITKTGDGYAGWAEYAPFDAIIVTAAPDHVPAALVEQLKAGGRMVIPVGNQRQKLLSIQKHDDGTAVSTEIVPVSFVPLTRRR